MAPTIAAATTAAFAGFPLLECGNAFGAARKRRLAAGRCFGDRRLGSRLARSTGFARFARLPRFARRTGLTRWLALALLTRWPGFALRLPFARFAALWAVALLRSAAALSGPLLRRLRFATFLRPLATAPLIAAAVATTLVAPPVASFATVLATLAVAIAAAEVALIASFASMLTRRA